MAIKRIFYCIFTLSVFLGFFSASTSKSSAAMSSKQTQEEDERKELQDLQNQILKDKFDVILPQIMREREIDMWIHIVREGDLDPLGYIFGSNEGIFIFTDRGGDRIERAFFGFNADKVDESGAYDIIVKPEIKIPLEAYPNIRIFLVDFYRMGGAEWPGGPKTELDFRFPGIGEFVAERDPKRIAVNYLEDLDPPYFMRFPGCGRTAFRIRITTCWSRRSATSMQGGLCHPNILSSIILRGLSKASLTFILGSVPISMKNIKRL